MVKSTPSRVGKAQRNKGPKVDSGSTGWLFIPMAPPARSAVVGQSSVELPWGFHGLLQLVLSSRLLWPLRMWYLNICTDVQPGDSCAEEEITVQYVWLLIPASCHSFLSHPAPGCGVPRSNPSSLHSELVERFKQQLFYTLLNTGWQR